MHANLVALFAGFLATGVMGAESPIPGYRIEPIQWKIEVSPGQIVQLNGTVQEVHAQALKINPNFKLKTPAPLPKPVRGPTHQKRGVKDCNNVFPTASVDHIREGVTYLRGVSGQPVEGPGPGACGRVSCSYNSAIYWCNDNQQQFSLNTFDQIANSAMFITQVCPWVVTSIDNEVSGHNFESQNWNTIVRGGDSC